MGNSVRTYVDILVLFYALELQHKIGGPTDKTFYLFKVIRPHPLPLTNMAFNKSGSR